MVKATFDLDENIAAALSYVLGWITGLVFFLFEERNQFVRFHAMQSIMIFLPITIILVILWWIPFFGWVAASVISVLALLLWIILLIKAYQGEKFKIPIAGDMAEDFSKKKI